MRRMAPESKVEVGGKAEDVSGLYLLNLHIPETTNVRGVLAGVGVAE